MCLFESQTHESNYRKFQLSADIEKKAGNTPMYIDPCKTITAPYSQANELVFGQNSGQQCVEMSLCSLIYNSKQGIKCSSAGLEKKSRSVGTSNFLSLLAPRAKAQARRSPTKG